MAGKKITKVQERIALLVLTKETINVEQEWHNAETEVLDFIKSMSGRKEPMNEEEVETLNELHCFANFWLDCMLGKKEFQKRIEVICKKQYPNELYELPKIINCDLRLQPRKRTD